MPTRETMDSKGPWKVPGYDIDSLMDSLPDDADAESGTGSGGKPAAGPAMPVPQVPTVPTGVQVMKQDRSSRKVQGIHW